MTSEMRELLSLAGTFASVVFGTFMLSICLWIAGYWVLSTAIQSVNSYDDRPAARAYDCVEKTDWRRKA